MKFICKSVSGDSNITFYNLDDETPVLIIESDSYEVKNGEILINVSEEVSKEIMELIRESDCNFKWR